MVFDSLCHGFQCLSEGLALREREYCGLYPFPLEADGISGWTPGHFRPLDLITALATMERLTSRLPAMADAPAIAR